MVKLHKSWTVWFQYLVASLGVLEVNMHLLQDALGTNYGYVFIAVSAVSVMLRMKTDTAIKDK